MSSPELSSTVRWGILGTGVIADAFATGLGYVDGAVLHAVGSRTTASAEAFADRHGAAHAHSSYQSLVDDPAVDVVYVATPNELHQEHCLMAIAAGRAVLCEKPFALDAAQAAVVVDAARRAGVFCMEAMWMRCSPVVQRVIELVDQGGIGEPRLLSAQLGFPNDVDPAGRLFARHGGGVLLDLGVYPVSLAHALFGTPTRVTASAVLLDSGVDEQVTALLDYPGGRQAVIAAGLRSQLSNSASVHGTAGIVRIDEPIVFPHHFSRTLIPVRRPGAGGSGGRGSGGAKARLRNHPVGRLLAEQRTRLRTRGTTLRARGNGYSAEAAEVQRCLAAGLPESPIITLDETIAVLGTMDAIRSAWAGEA